MLLQLQDDTPDVLEQTWYKHIGGTCLQTMLSTASQYLRPVKGPQRPCVLYRKSMDDKYHFGCQFTADLIAMNTAGEYMHHVIWTLHAPLALNSVAEHHVAVTCACQQIAQGSYSELCTPYRTGLTIIASLHDCHYALHCLCWCTHHLMFLLSEVIVTRAKWKVI